MPQSRNDICSTLTRQFRHHLLDQGYARGTVLQREGDVARLANLHPLLQVTADDLATYLSPARTAWRPEYRKRVSASLRIFFTWAHARGLIDSNPALALAPVRVPRAIPRPVPEAVVLSGFSAGTLAERAMLALGATLGLRREEIASAHPRNRSGATLRVVGKNSDERVLPLDDLTASLLHELEVEQGIDSYYFPGRFGGHVHPATVYKWVKARLGGEWSTHNLRHRAATIGLETTGDIRAVQEMLGHRSITSTQLYTAVTGTRILDVVAATSLGEDSSSRRVAGTPLFATMKLPTTDQEKLELAMRLLAEVHSIERVH